MKIKYAKSWKLPRGGLTLVEALAGTAILGTLLVGLLLASSRLAVQTRSAERRMEACRIAEMMLSLWWKEADKIPRDKSADVPGCSGWRWQTRVESNRDAKALGAEVVALEIYSTSQDDEVPAARVEILLPSADYLRIR